MQKILFYQKRKPKTADGLWMHKDADGNMKLDYVSNGRVKPLGYMNSEAGGSASDGYKAYIILNPSSEVRNSDSDGGVSFTNSEDAAQALGISEQDFLKFFCDQMPAYIAIDDAVMSLTGHESSNAGEYIIGWSMYNGSVNGSDIYFISISAEQNDDEQAYNIYMEVTQSGTPK